MDNLAYLHVAFAYEDENSNNDLIAFNFLIDEAAAPNWRKLSSRAWNYMLPLALTLSILSVANSALALQREDRGPSVRNLQQRLKQVGFYQAPITQVFDTSTEEAVRRFQKAAGLDVNGIAGPVTLEKLQSWKVSAQSTQNTKPSLRNAINSSSNTTTVAARTTRVSSPSTGSIRPTKRKNPNFLQRGDEGEDIKLLQERLRVAGFYHGSSIGIFGPITEEAVKRFQQAYNLNVDGVVGAETLSKLPPAGVGYGDDYNNPPQPRNKDMLRLGDRGEAVRILQEQLIEAGYLEGEPTGYFGPNTDDAVRRFQGNNYLAVSGIAGPTTRGKLHNLVKNTPKSEFSVLEIQRRLHARGFYKGPLNGVMADDTKQAIRQAQEFYGISLSDVRGGRF
jgi:peptidoglycan hydrolase-like protein with peptidoglycan-binding domain